jgi:hypothetical protein
LVRIEFGGPQLCDVKLFTNTPQADFVGQGDREDPKGVLRGAAGGGRRRWEKGGEGEKEKEKVSERGGSKSFV